MSETQDYYRCDCCNKLCNRDEISLMNEFDLDLCDDCLDGQRELDVQDEVDLDFVRDVRMEIEEMQKMERRDNHGL